MMSLRTERRVIGLILLSLPVIILGGAMIALLFQNTVIFGITLIGLALWIAVVFLVIAAVYGWSLFAERDEDER